MAHVVGIERAVGIEHAYRDSRQGLAQHLGDVRAGKVATVLAHVERAFLYWRVACGAQHGGSWLCGPAVVVAQHAVPQARVFAENRQGRVGTCTVPGGTNRRAESKAVRQLMKSNGRKIETRRLERLLGRFMQTLVQGKRA